jgi:hypothetical protein
LSPSTNPFDDDAAVLQTNHALAAKNMPLVQSIRAPAVKGVRYVSFGEAASASHSGGGAFANGTNHSLDSTGYGPTSYFPRAPASMDASESDDNIGSIDSSKDGILKLTSLIEVGLPAELIKLPPTKIIALK